MIFASARLADESAIMTLKERALAACLPLWQATALLAGGQRILACGNGSHQTASRRLAGSRMTPNTMRPLAGFAASYGLQASGVRRWPAEGCETGGNGRFGHLL